MRICSCIWKYFQMIEEERGSNDEKVFLLGKEDYLQE